MFEDVQELTDDEVLALIMEPKDAFPQEYPEVDKIFRYYEPLQNAADEFVFQCTTRDSRVFTGIDSFDSAMRGLGPKELMLVQGYAHSGKTLFVTNLLMHNRHRRVVLFTPDESRVLVLIKLVSLVHGISAEVLEDRIATGDPEATSLIKDTVTEHFPLLAVFDDLDEIGPMDRALDEVAEVWGAEAELVIFDFVDLLSTNDVGDGATKGKVKTLKSWGKKRNLRLVLLHQSSRTAGADGAEQTISSGSYGGEAEATYVIGVRRKRDYWKAQVRDLEEKQRSQMKPSANLADMLELARYELFCHQDTVTFNIVKNKRPPSRLVEEVDFKLDAQTGNVTPLGQGELAHRVGPATRIVNREMF